MKLTYYSNRVFEKTTYKVNGIEITEDWSGNCCYTGKPVTEKVKVFSYWNAYPMWADKDSAKQGKKDEAYECQKIDADCNDCFFFQRGQHISKSGGGVWSGHCKKYDKPTKAYPNYASGHECFVHRKDGS